MLIGSLILSVCSLQAQSSWSQPTGGRAIALSGNTENFRDIHAIFHNQAGLGYLSETAVMAAYEQRFLLSGLRTSAIGIALPTHSGSLGMQVQLFGNEHYHEGKAGIVYARRLLDKLSIGASVNYLFFRVADAGSRGTVSFDAGFQGEVFEGFELGVHVTNPVRQTIQQDQYLPTILRLGARYRFSRFLAALGGIEKDIDLPYNLKFGLEYQFQEVFYLRLGMQSLPGSASFGFGAVIMEQLNLDLGTAWDARLGWSPAINLLYRWKKK